MSLAKLLPRPKAATTVTKSKWASDDEDDDNDTHNVEPTRRGPPPYGQRRNFVPRTQEDFGDGGAFPEIPVVQYPMDMGKKRAGGSQRIETLPLQTDGEGNIRYDMILRSGDKNSKAIVHAQLKDLQEQDVLEADELQRPDEDTIRETAERTRAALEGRVDAKLKASQPKQITTAKKGPTYVKYTPTQQHAGQNSGAASRIIKLVEAPIDPMEPPKFKHKKVPRPPPSPPPPVLHSPPRKVSAEEQKNWVIPPCISNWKNAKGYTIPLDKRLAADGRGLQEMSINDNFAKLSEALFIADRHARDEVRIRSEMQSKLASKEKREKEERLRMLAQRAREERAGLVSGEAAAPRTERSANDSEESDDDESIDEREREQLKEREELRRERQKQREREFRMSHMGADTKARVLSKSTERDISEKIALGLAQPTMSKEAMFDSRLFNQAQGIGAGFGGDDAYDLYDKPLFQGSSANAIYKPKKAEEGVVGVSTEKLEQMLGDNGPHRGFQGTDGPARQGPVQFEKEQADVFGIDEFMSTAKRGREKEDAGGESSKRSRRD